MENTTQLEVVNDHTPNNVFQKSMLTTAITHVFITSIILFVVAQFDFNKAVEQTKQSIQDKQSLFVKHDLKMKPEFMQNINDYLFIPSVHYSINEYKALTLLDRSLIATLVTQVSGNQSQQLKNALQSLTSSDLERQNQQLASIFSLSRIIGDALVFEMLLIIASIGLFSLSAMNSNNHSGNTLVKNIADHNVLYGLLLVYLIVSVEIGSYPVILSATQ